MQFDFNIQQRLLDLLAILLHFSPVQLRELCLFAQSDSGCRYELWLPQLVPLLQKITPQQLQALVSYTENKEEDEESQLFVDKLAMEYSIPSVELKATFSLLMSLYLLQDLLQKVSISQLMKLFEVIPEAVPIQQLQLLQQIQQLLGQLLVETLQGLKQKMEEAQPHGNDHQVLVQLLNLPSEFFHLYQPLRLLLQLEEDELLKLRENIPTLKPVQMLQLLQLLQIQPIEVLQLCNLLNPQNTVTFAGDPEDQMMDSITPRYLSFILPRNCSI
jgi:hypothetical protein